MSLFNIDDDTPCRHCGADFADHDYVPDSIDQYECPRPHQDSVYGFFCGGDPRNFHPDFESCSEGEIANWKRACEEADKSDAAARLKCPSGNVHDENGEWRAHILKAPFGIGVQVFETTTFFEPRERDDPAQSYMFDEEFDT